MRTCKATRTVTVCVCGGNTSALDPLASVPCELRTDAKRVFCLRVSLRDCNATGKDWMKTLWAMRFLC
jgi:hypothetical protein